jgi:hypothetical protein
MGRPTIYTQELAESILEELAQGKSLVQVCSADEMPGLRTVMRWAKENDDFGTQYAHAREAQAEIMDDKILTTADGTNAENAAAQRVKVDAYKWRASKLAPKRFGDKIDVTSGDKPVGEMDETAIAVRIASLLRSGLERDGGDGAV